MVFWRIFIARSLALRNEGTAILAINATRYTKIRLRRLKRAKTLVNGALNL